MRKRVAEPEPQTVELDPLLLRAEIQVDTANQATRTVDLVFSTGAAAVQFHPSIGRHVETLSLKPEHVRLGRLNGGAPLLNSHKGDDIKNVIGAVVPGTGRLEGGQGRATVKFSKRAEVEPYWRDVLDGIIGNISVGYRVHRYEKHGDDINGLPNLRATDWEPYELSAVPMGADAGARIRAEGQVATNPCVIVTRAAPPTPKETPTMGDETREQDVTEDVERAATTTAPEPPEPNDADRATVLERERVQGIMRACSAVRLPSSQAEKMIAEGVPLLDAQTRIFEMVRVRAADDVGPKPGGNRAAVIGDPLDNVWRGITGALLHRIDANTWKLDDNSRQYRSRSLLDFGRECLEQRGFRTRDYSKMDIAGMALGLQVRAGLHTTSDFANILADVANKTLRRAYEESPQTWQPLGRRIQIADFKPLNRNQLGEAPALLRVLEHGEFTRGTIGEGKEVIQLATYGRVFGVTRQALVNDDMDAFGRLTTMFGRAARNLESDIVWYQILKNAAMADTVALFHASHNNLAAVAAAINIGPLGIGRAALGSQTGVNASTYLNLRARYLVVPPVLETVADQYTTAVTPALSASVNPFAGRLQVISEPRLAGTITVDGDTVTGSATAWYLFASPDQIDIIEYGSLDGEEGPVVESRVGFDIDGLEVKARHDFAAKVIDFRGAWKNAGV